MEFEQMMARKQRVTTSETIIIDHKWADSLDDARRAVFRASQEARVAGRDPEDDEAWQEANADVQALLGQQAEAVQVFTFRAIGRPEYQRILDDHQPTLAQRKEAPGLAWNPLTFPQALVAATSLEPRMTEQQVDEMWNSVEWTAGELGKLWGAANASVTHIRQIDLD